MRRAEEREFRLTPLQPAYAYFDPSPNLGAKTADNCIEIGLKFLVMAYLGTR
jgi:hypothetical protein